MSQRWVCHLHIQRLDSTLIGVWGPYETHRWSLLVVCNNFSKSSIFFLTLFLIWDFVKWHSPLIFFKITLCHITFIGKWCSAPLYLLGNDTPSSSPLFKKKKKKGKLHYSPLRYRRMTINPKLELKWQSHFSDLT